MNLLERFLSVSKSPLINAWVIDPETQTITAEHGEKKYIESLIEENVGDDADYLYIDRNDNILWYSDTDTNERYAYYFEGLTRDFEVRRYSKALIVNLGLVPFGQVTIEEYLRWHDQEDFWDHIAGDRW